MPHETKGNINVGAHREVGALSLNFSLIGRRKSMIIRSHGLRQYAFPQRQQYLSCQKRLRMTNDIRKGLLAINNKLKVLLANKDLSPADAQKLYKTNNAVVDAIIAMNP